MPRKNCRHFAQSTRIAATCVLPATSEDSSKRHHFARRELRRALPREEFGDALVARDVTFAAEHAPVDRQRRQTERAAMMRERVEEGIGRAVVALRRIAEDAGDRREHHEAIERQVARALRAAATRRTPSAP